MFLGFIMIKKCALLVLLLSFSSFSMEISQEEITATKQQLIKVHKTLLEEKIARHERLVKWLLRGTIAAGVAAVATKFGYLSGEKIGTRGWGLISGGCGLLCIGGISSIGKAQSQIKSLPKLLTDDYVRNYLQNQNKLNPKI